MSTTSTRPSLLTLALALLVGGHAAVGAEDWVQLKYDSRRAGDVPERSVSRPLGLLGAVPLTDTVFTAPVVAGGRVYVVDGSGVAFCLDTETLDEVWRFASPGGAANCNNVCSPALSGGYLHFGTMAGQHYVLDAATGAVVKKIDCGDESSSAALRDQRRERQAGTRPAALGPEGGLQALVPTLHRRQVAAGEQRQRPAKLVGRGAGLGRVDGRGHTFQSCAHRHGVGGEGG